MPAYPTSNPGPEDSMYSDAAPAAEKPSQETDEGNEGATAEIPKSLLGGKDFEPGDEVVLKIHQILEDSVVVSYATEKSEAHEESEPTEENKGAMAAPPDSEMSSMME